MGFVGAVVSKSKAAAYKNAKEHRRRCSRCWTFAIGDSTTECPVYAGLRRKRKGMALWLRGSGGRT